MLNEIREIRNTAAHEIWHMDEPEIKARLELLKKGATAKINLALKSFLCDVGPLGTYDMAIGMFIINMYIATIYARPLKVMNRFIV